MAAYANNTTQATYEEPWVQAMRQGYLNSMFDFARQPTPVPVRQVAGLSPEELKARELSGGLGGFTPYFEQGAQMMQGGYGTQQQGRDMYGRGADATNVGIGLYGRGANLTDQASSFYAPGAAAQFYNPYEQDVVQQTLADLKEAGIGQGYADRAGQVGQGAFGGSRGRIMAGERARQLGRGAAEAVGAIRSKGFEGARSAAQTAGQGLGQLGSQFGQFGQGMGQLGGQFGQFGQGLGSLGTQMGQMGTNFAGLGTTGQSNLLRQIDALNQQGGTSRGIQDKMYGAQFDAATGLAAEPGNRLGILGAVLKQLLPTDKSTTTFGSAASDNNAFNIMSLLGLLGGGQGS
jgi:hypothetical protein